MSGRATFIITGRLTYVKDYAPEPNKPWAKLNLRVELDPCPVTLGQTNVTVPRHGMFLSVRYDQKDLGKPRFEQVKAMLAKGACIFAQGNIKPQAATPQRPAALGLDSSWRDIRVSNEPFAPVNYVEVDGDVVNLSPQYLDLKYSYRNPKAPPGENPWKDRNYRLVTAQVAAERAPRTSVFVRGKIFGVNPYNGNTANWILAEEIY